MTDQEIKLLEVAQKIGSISGCNCHYTAMLARKIEQAGKSVENMTVADLALIHDEVGAEYNALAAKHNTLVVHADSGKVERVAA